MTKVVLRSQDAHLYSADFDKPGVRVELLQGAVFQVGKTAVQVDRTSRPDAVGECGQRGGMFFRADVEIDIAKRTKAALVVPGSRPAFAEQRIDSRRTEARDHLLNSLFVQLCLQ